MRIYPTINMWIEGEMRLEFYESTSEHVAYGCTVKDSKDEPMAPCFFVEEQHKETLKSAIEAFNRVWEQKHGTEN